MKKIIFLAFLLGACLGTSAQRLHTLIYADTNDPKIGAAAKLSRNNYGRTCAEIATALTWYDSPAPIVRDGYNCNKENLLKDIQNLNCTEKDIVIFIYCGHGSRSPIDESDFPQMCMAEQPGQPNDGSGYYSLENVRNLIMRKRPRFCLTIGDCCNSEDPNLDPQTIIQGNPAEKNIIVEGDKCVRDLFFKKNGSVILTASRKKEYGWSNNSFGMYLQREFSHEMSRILNQQVSFNTWDNFLEKIKRNVESYNIVDKYGKYWKQHPFYRVDLKESPIINPDTIKSDTIVPPPESHGIREELLQIADDRKFTETQRIAKRKKVLKEYFSDACIIDVAGKDGKTITLTMTAEQYLRRISLEEGLTNIVIFEQIYDKNGKIMYLELHEIYREIKRKI